MSTINVIFKHRSKANDCKHVVTVRTTREGNFLVTEAGEPLRYTAYGYTRKCEACSKTMTGVSVSGKVNAEKACSARCQSATGPSCECACGGENHGAAHA